MNETTNAPLREALWGNDPAAVHAVLDQGLRPVENAFLVEKSLLIAIRRHGEDGTLIRRLLDLGAQPHPWNNILGSAPLCVAAAEGQIASIQVLLAEGAQVNALDPAGRTPLFLAVERGLAETVTVLLAAGANPDLRWDPSTSLTDVARAFLLDQAEDPTPMDERDPKVDPVRTLQILEEHALRKTLKDSPNVPRPTPARL